MAWDASSREESGSLVQEVVLEEVGSGEREEGGGRVVEGDGDVVDARSKRRDVGVQGKPVARRRKVLHDDRVGMAQRRL